MGYGIRSCAPVRALRHSSCDEKRAQRVLGSEHAPDWLHLHYFRKENPHDHMQYNIPQESVIYDQHQWKCIVEKRKRAMRWKRSCVYLPLVVERRLERMGIESGMPRKKNKRMRRKKRVPRSPKPGPSTAVDDDSSTSYEWTTDDADSDEEPDRRRRGFRPTFASMKSAWQNRRMSQLIPKVSNAIITGMNSNAILLYTSLYGFPDSLRFGCFCIGGEPFVNVPQILRSLSSLENVKIEDVMRAMQKYQVYLMPCNARQTNTLVRAGIIRNAPYVTPSLVSKTTAERILGDVLDVSEPQPDDEIDELRKDSFPVEHDCFGGAKGIYLEKVYKIQCEECLRLFVPESFVLHTHEETEIQRTVHWGFDSSRWRDLINLPFEEREKPCHVGRFTRLICEPFPQIDVAIVAGGAKFRVRRDALGNPVCRPGMHKLEKRWQKVVVTQSKLRTDPFGLSMYELARLEEAPRTLVAVEEVVQKSTTLSVQTEDVEIPALRRRSITPIVQEPPSKRAYVEDSRPATPASLSPPAKISKSMATDVVEETTKATEQLHQRTEIAELVQKEKYTEEPSICHSVVPYAYGAISKKLADEGDDLAHLQDSQLEERLRKLVPKDAWGEIARVVAEHNEECHARAVKADAAAANYQMRYNQMVSSYYGIYQVLYAVNSANDTMFHEGKAAFSDTLRQQVSDLRESTVAYMNSIPKPEELMQGTVVPPPPVSVIKPQLPFLPAQSMDILKILQEPQSGKEAKFSDSHPRPYMPPLSLVPTTNPSKTTPLSITAPGRPSLQMTSPIKPQYQRPPGRPGPGRPPKKMSVPASFVPTPLSVTTQAAPVTGKVSSMTAGTQNGSVMGHLKSSQNGLLMTQQQSQLGNGTTLAALLAQARATTALQQATVLGKLGTSGLPLSLRTEVDTNTLMNQFLGAPNALFPSSFAAMHEAGAKAAVLQSVTPIFFSESTNGLVEGSVNAGPVTVTNDLLAVLNNLTPQQQQQLLFSPTLNAA